MNHRLNHQPAPPEGGPSAPSGLTLQLDAHALRPLIAQVVAEVLTQVRDDEAKLSGKLVYTEEEAARLLEVEPWVLRDERRRGRIGCSQIVGKRIRYTREDLIAYLAGRRWVNKE